MSYHTSVISPNRRWIGAAVSAALLSLTLRSLAVDLTGATVYSSQSDGSEGGYQFWSTMNRVFYLGISRGDASNPLEPLPHALELADGLNHFSIFGAPGAVSSYNGLNLFFEGSNSPDISAVGSLNSGIFGPNAGSSTLALDTTRVPGAGTLEYQAGDKVITLEAFEWHEPASGGTDKVSPYALQPDGTPDFVGRFTLRVSSASVPDTTTPATCLGLSVGALALLRRTRRP